MLARSIKRLLELVGLQISRRHETLVIPRPKAGPGHFACVGIDWNEAAVEASFDELAGEVDELLASIAENRARYNPQNGFFGIVDAAIAYAQVRRHRPDVIVEVGSGYSSAVLRQALDQNGGGQLISIDPSPRIAVDGVADESLAVAVESIGGERLAAMVGAGILFIDSSHVVATGNDVTHLFLEVLPRLAAGAIIHVHDIYLPEDYPPSWNIARGFNYSEQYLLHALLCSSCAFEVLWPGRWVLRRHRDRLARLIGGEHGLEAHCSFWLRRR